MMSFGLTRSEQLTLAGAVFVIVVGMVAQEYRPDGEKGWRADRGAGWEPIELPIRASAFTPGGVRVSTSISGEGPLRTVSRDASTTASLANADAAIDLNLATEAELDRLPGIGPSSAKAIVEFRNRNGFFQSVDQLEAVKGIGPATIRKLRPYLIAGAPANQRQATAKVEQKPNSPTPEVILSPPPPIININTASLDDLEQLPGIGPVLAQRIIDFRSRHPFKQPEDLIGVRGIGEKTFAKMRPWVKVE